jgi:hypothetical protein
MQKTHESGPVQGQQFTSWINDAPPEDAIRVARLALGRVAQLDRTYRDRFLSEIGKDPQMASLLEEVKTPA